MLEEFEGYFDVVDVAELKAFLKEAKDESEWIKSQDNFEDDPEAGELVKFMTALLENIEEEVGELTSFKTLDLKSKLRLYSMIHLFHELCDSMGDEGEEFAGWDGFDEDEGDLDSESDNSDDKHNGNSRIIKLE